MAASTAVASGYDGFGRGYDGYGRGYDEGYDRVYGGGYDVPAAAPVKASCPDSKDEHSIFNS